LDEPRTTGFCKDRCEAFASGPGCGDQADDGRRIGTIGRLSEEIVSSYKFRQPVYVLELDLSALLTSQEKVVQYAPLPRYPAVVRDLSLLVSRNVTVGEIMRAVSDRGVAECRGVKLVGTYEGPNVPSGKRSVTLRIEYRSDERTLRDEEVEQQHADLTTSLLQTFGAEQH